MQFLKKLPMILLGLAMASCNTMTPKPSGTIWTIDTKKQSALGVPFNEMDNPHAESINEKLSYLNGSICFLGEDWASIQYYIDHLRNHQCQ